MSSPEVWWQASLPFSPMSLYPSSRLRFIDKDERVCFHNNVNNSPLSSVQKRQADRSGCAVCRPVVPGLVSPWGLVWCASTHLGVTLPVWLSSHQRPQFLYDCRLTPSFTSISFNPLVTFNPAQFIQCIIHNLTSWEQLCLNVFDVEFYP